MSPIIVSIEGNIGAGKSTLIEHMKKYHQSNPQIQFICTVAVGCHVFLYVFFFKIVKENLLACYIAYTILAIILHFQILKNMERPKKKIIFLEEPVKMWERIVDFNDGKNILQKYGENQEKYAFAFQMMCLNTRLRVLIDALYDNPDADVIVCERSIYSDAEIFARMLYQNGILDEVQYQIYCLWFEMATANDIPKHEFIYLRSQPEYSTVRKEARNRAGEENIDFEYMQKLYLYHEEFFNKVEPILVVEIDPILESPREYRSLIRDIFARIDVLFDARQSSTCEAADKVEQK